MSAIKDAVDGVLKDNGIDPETVSGQMPPPPPGGMPPGPPPGPPPGRRFSEARPIRQTSSSGSTSSSTSTSDEIQKLIESMQELIAKLQSNQADGNAVSGYLFDQVS